MYSLLSINLHVAGMDVVLGLAIVRTSTGMIVLNIDNFNTRWIENQGSCTCNSTCYYTCS